MKNSSIGGFTKHNFLEALKVLPTIGMPNDKMYVSDELFMELCGFDPINNNILGEKEVTLFGIKVIRTPLDKLPSPRTAIFSPPDAFLEEGDTRRLEWTFNK